MSLRSQLSAMPLIAILRGIRPEEAEVVFAALVEPGIRIIEVPLNSPRPLETIASLATRAGADMLIGAGTVLTAEGARAAARAGARLMLAPNCDPAVIAAARDSGLATIPGVATPSEAFVALGAGADALKLFPGEQLGPVVLKAWRAVLPPEALVLPVGGVSLDNMADYVAAGAAGFGVGSALYQPGVAPEDIRQKALFFVERCRALFPDCDGSKSGR
jgi:2-dehydro-3-deoxyphosphogalactonate aldolase